MANEASGNTGAAPQGGQPELNTQPEIQTQKGQNQTPPQPKSWKTKVDGKEVAWTNEEELVRDAGLGKAAFQRMREASDEKRSVQSFWEQFEKDPLSVLENPRLKITEEQRREMIEKYYQKKYMETDNLTPEKKRIMELEAEKKKWEEDKKAEDQKKKSDQQKVLEGKWRETYQQQIIDAIEKGGFPKTPRTAARVAFYMAHAADSGFDAPMEMIIQQVGKDYEAEFQTILDEKVPMEAILKVIPPGFLKRLRKYDIDQYKARQAKLNNPPPADPQNSNASPKKKQEQRLPYSEVLKRFGS